MRTPTTKRLMSAATIGVTGLVTVGLLSLQSGAAAEDAKREDDSVELALTSDDDDADGDDTNGDDPTTQTNGDTNGDTGTGFSKSTNDNTNSRFTGVSRDRDNSRSDKTRDWTRDGGGTRTRDHSGNQTNDRSRNDTR
jgi:hypothetical protein